MCASDRGGSRSPIDVRQIPVFAGMTEYFATFRLRKTQVLLWRMDHRDDRNWEGRMAVRAIIQLSEEAVKIFKA